ncbi:PREDICTED: uncharacterized protein LOC103595476 [Galeopterus variegatus]|uniref:Uncharacterized protein LOC103595476 n=1 Tax=Galeopterus variegatus TaxID=482537 RepID=A0ABM0R921_GALVR|nr:PREDICTED: uncharacterized protein LOC103595476 [Galeopterus variegatus]
MAEGGLEEKNPKRLAGADRADRPGDGQVENRHVEVMVQVIHKRNHMNFAESIWREFLDPYNGDSEDILCRSSFSFNTCPLGDMNCNVASYALKWKSPEEVNLEDYFSLKTPDPIKRATGWDPTPLEASDVDMQPEDSRITEEDWEPRAAKHLLTTGEPSENGRHMLNRARGTRPPPRLGSERDKGPKLSLSKRKLELLLVEPEKNKRKRQYVA